MKITAIKQQIKNTDRASVFVDSKYAFSLSLSEILEQKLKNGLDLAQGDIKRLKKLSDDGKLKSRALEWVLTRPRSIREFKDYMFRKKADPELTQKLIAEFSDHSYLSDQRFAQWLMDVRRRQGKSERAIKAELAKKGIDRTIIADMNEEGGSELDRIRAIVDKKGKLPRYKMDPTKLMAYLARQGFSYDDIKQVLNN